MIEKELSRQVKIQKNLSDEDKENNLLNTNKRRWPLSIKLHPAYQMRLYSPTGESVKEEREKLRNNLQEDKDLQEYLDKDFKNTEEWRHTCMPCYFHKRDRTWTAFYINRDYIKGEEIEGNEKKQRLDYLMVHLSKLIGRLIEIALEKKEPYQLLWDYIYDDLPFIERIIQEYRKEYKDESKMMEGKDDLEKIRDLTNDRMKHLSADVIDVCLYTLLRFRSYGEWYESGIAHRTLSYFKKAYKKKSLPKCWYMEAIEKNVERRVDIIQYIKDKKEYFIDSDHSLQSVQKIPQYHRNQQQEVFDGFMNIRQHLYIPLFHLFNKDRGDIFTEELRKIYEGKEVMKIGSKDCLINDAIVIPVFEIYINGTGYGRLQGLYVLYREGQKELLSRLSTNIAKKIKIETAKYALESIEPIVQEISEKIFLSDIMIARKELENTLSTFESPFRYFLEIIIYCQDWENIWVCEKSENPDKDTKIHFWWGRKAKTTDNNSNEQMTPVRWESLLEEKNEDNLKAVNNAKQKNYHNLLMKECGLFAPQKDKSDDNKKNESDEDKYHNYYEIVFEYPKDTILPVSDDEYELYLYKEKMNDKLTRIMQVAYDIWKTNKYQDSVRKADGYISQMSHNLNHALDGIRMELEETISPKLEDKKQGSDSSLCLDPTKLKKDLKEKDRLESLIGHHNFYMYLKDRFEGFKDLKSKDPGTDLIKPFKAMVKDFNRQILFKKYITWATKDNDSKPYDVKLIDIISNELDIKVRYDILYMILENYIRNVPKHNILVKSEVNLMRCYLKIARCIDSRDKLDVSIWEDSRKEISPCEFYKSYKKLEKIYGEKVSARPFIIEKGGGTNAIVCLVDSLNKRYPVEKPHLEIKPVFVEEDGRERHEILHDPDRENYFYMSENERTELSENASYRFSIEYNFKMDIL